jgi:hypothetical protein
MISVYQAGPIRCADDDGHGWRDELCQRVKSIDWLNPLAHHDAAGELTIVGNEDYERAFESGYITVSELVTADKQLLRQADAVLVGYEDVKQIGTPMEVCLAAQASVPVVIWLRDGSAEHELSAWYRHHADRIVAERDAAVDAIRQEVRR